MNTYLTYSWFLAFVAFMLCPLGVFSPRSATWLIITLGVLGLYKSRKNIRAIARKKLSLYVLSLSGYMLISSLWAVNPMHSVKGSLLFLGLMLCGMGMYAIFKNLTPAEQERTAKALAAGMALAFILLTLEWVFGRPWLKCCNITPAKAYTNASIMLAVFFWPVVNRLHKTYYKILVLVMSMLMLLLADCDASILGLLGASFVVAFWRVLRPYFGPLWVGAMAIAFIVVPVGFNLFLTDLQIVKINEKMRFFSYVHRLYVWQASSQKIKDYHYMGAGMDASRLDSVGGEVKEYYFLRSDNRIDPFRSREIPMHPHNIPLQIWLELGAIGVVLFLTLITYVGRLPLSSEMASVIIVMSLAGLVSVGAWQSWFISTLMFAMYFCHFIAHRRKVA